MSDPISTYRNVCQPTMPLVGESASDLQTARRCGNAGVAMVQEAIDGLRHNSLDLAGARAVHDAAYAESQQPQLHRPEVSDIRSQLTAKMAELNARIAELDPARTARQDHVAPTARPTARATSPAATLTAGIRPDLGQLRGNNLIARIQGSLFGDRAQTTRTLSALASMTPAALHDLVTARVGPDRATAVLETLGEHAQTQMRYRISERAHASLMRGVERLEQRSTGEGLQATLNQLRGPQRAPVLATLEALGADTDELRSLIVRQNEPEARHALALIVADTMSGGAAQMRELAQRYDGAHNALDSEGALYRLFPESVRQVGAQLGMPADLTRSALGAFVREDVADAARNTAINGAFVVLAGVALALATGGSGVLGGLAASGVRVSADAGVAFEHADEMTLSATAGETTSESADAARRHARWEVGTAVVGSLVSAGVGRAVEEAAPALGHAAGGLVERAVEDLMTIEAGEVRHSYDDPPIQHTSQ